MILTDRRRGHKSEVCGNGPGTAPIFPAGRERPRGAAPLHSLIYFTRAAVCRLIICPVCHRRLHPRAVGPPGAPRCPGGGGAEQGRCPSPVPTLFPPGGRRPVTDPPLPLPARPSSGGRPPGPCAATGWCGSAGSGRSVPVCRWRRRVRPCRPRPAPGR